MDKYRFYAFKLIAIMVVIFIVQMVVPGFTDLFVLDQSSWTQIWRFVTSIFLHGGLAHLMYNMFALMLFGSVVERVIGSRRFLIVFFATGLFASLVSVNFYNSALGASGAIFGVIGALVLLRPMMTIWAFSLPMPMFLAGILWAAGDLVGVFVPSNVANIAHLSGMAFGLFLGIYYRRMVKIRKNREGLRVVLDESSMRRWEDVYLR